MLDEHDHDLVRLRERRSSLHAPGEAAGRRQTFAAALASNRDITSSATGRGLPAAKRRAGPDDLRAATAKVRSCQPAPSRQGALFFQVVSVSASGMETRTAGTRCPGLGQPQRPYPDHHTQQLSGLTGRPIPWRVPAWLTTGLRLPGRWSTRTRGRCTPRGASSAPRVPRAPDRASSSGWRCGVRPPLPPRPPRSGPRTGRAWGGARRALA